MNRIEQLSQWLEDERCGALITSEVSRRYLSEYASTDGIMLITKEESYFLIDARYFDHAKQQAKNCTVILLTDTGKQLLELLIKHGIKRLHIESDTLTVRELEHYREILHYSELDSGNELSDKLREMRIIKSAEEIALITKAQRIAEKAFERLLGTIRAGMTEKQVSALLEYYIMDSGADGISFDTIAASGINSSVPHAVPTDKELKEGEFLTLDFGALYDGYHSDMTRTLAVGSVSEQMEEVYNAVYSANIDAMQAVRAGVGCKVADSVARSTLNAWNGLDKYFNHGLGHGVGLEIHEEPRLSQSSGTMLRTGMVVTIEPGAYISGKYGVRIEDMVVVTENGCDNLANVTKNLIHI